MPSWTIPIILLALSRDGYSSSRVCIGPLNLCWRLGTCFPLNSSLAGISYNHCCSLEGVTDTVNCWWHPGYPPEGCCPRLFELTQTQCPSALLDRVAWLLNRDAVDAPPVWEVATDEAAVEILLKKHTAPQCALAFIAHRLFLYTKIPRWPKHFEILVDPDAASLDVFSLSSMVTAFDFIKQLPLTSLLSDPVFAPLWLRRALGHWRKLKCYVWQDAWRLHPATGSCDANETPLEKEYKRYLAFSVNRGTLPDVEVSESMLLGKEVGCELSRICAALALSMHGRVSKEALNDWWTKLRSPGIIMTTSWPLLPLMSMASELVISTANVTAADSPHLVIIECSSHSIVKPSKHYSTVSIAPRECISRLPSLVPDTGYVGVLSPQQWDYENEVSLPLLVNTMAKDGITVAGLPVIDPDGGWAWPCLKFRRDDLFHEMITVSPYSTGYRSHSNSHACVACDTTSLSRVYKAETLRAILRRCGKSRSLQDFALCQDLVSLVSEGPKVHTCHHYHPIREPPYFSNLRHLPDWLSVFAGVTVFSAPDMSRPITACGVEHRGSFGPCEVFEFRAWLSSWFNRGDVFLHCASPFLPLPLHRYNVRQCPQVMNRALWLKITVCSQETSASTPTHGWESVNVIISNCSSMQLSAAFRLRRVHTGLLFGDTVQVWVQPSPAQPSFPKLDVEGPLAIRWNTPLQEMLALVSNSQREGEQFVALVWNHTSNHALSLLSSYATDDCSVAGGLIQYRDSLFWPARRVRYEWWKLELRSALPDRHTCQRAGSTSATRVYRTVTLLRILEHILNPEDSLHNESTASLNGSAKVLLFDAVASRLGVGVCTCNAVILYEEDWAQQLSTADFPGVQSIYIECVREDDTRDVCSPMKATNSSEVLAENYEFMEEYRSVTPLCNRLWLEDSFMRLVEWWVSAKGSRIAMARQGTLLATLYRSGGVGMIPWDYDLELNLVGLDRQFIGDPDSTGLCSAVAVAGVFGSVPMGACELLDDLTYGMETDRSVTSGSRVAIQLGPFTIAIISTPQLPTDLVAIRMFGSPFKLYFSLAHWDWWYHNIYRGSSAKLIGGGNVADHNPWELCNHQGIFGRSSCLPQCHHPNACDFPDLLPLTRASCGRWWEEQCRLHHHHRIANTSLISIATPS
ncbi:hypothetical protein FOL47_010367 [Perkinsus chesapeaki]|uniref:Uncharacterized protein n=1 Tax=Perkinsus chesapeaki TaxID=330153 RepID=A0A7J6N1M3_PERCH|nr:hypothetical protein FOL47_010367 [Perkinsus chesapeaki]